MRIKHPRRRRPRIELIPMIDTIFFVLVFFVVASISMVHQRGLRVDLPSATVGERPDRARVTITVRADGALYLDKAAVSSDELAPRLRSLLSSSPHAAVLLNADQRAEHGWVVAAMDAARRAGARSLTIAVSPGEQE